ncbi:MAG: hypothetical protein Q7S28_03460 [bacterium]|nr:hypothetical protein [bacterium]
MEILQTEQPGKLMGSDVNEYNKLAAGHSKANIFGWIIGGIAYSYFYGSLIGITTGLLIFPGIFIASFASILTFWGDRKMEEVVAGSENFLVLLGATVWLVVSKVYPYALGALFIINVNALLSQFSV